MAETLSADTPEPSVTNSEIAHNKQQQGKSISTSGGLRQAILLLVSASALVPLVGLVTSPLLAQALGVEGRGEAAAAVAPNTLLVSVATIGLPEALTYYVAKHPAITRRALLKAATFGTALGAICYLLVELALPFLSGGSAELGHLILVGTAIAIPQLIVNLLRGAASGRQMWKTIAAERTLNMVLRVSSLVVLFATGNLTVLTAVIAGCSSPVLAGIAYVRLLRRHTYNPLEVPFVGPVGRTLLGFGSRVWIGAVASMLLARIGQVLFAPISNTFELGLYTVAVNISDVPLIAAVAIRDALYGVNAKQGNPHQIAAASRITLLLGTLGCLALGGSLPFWITPIFGEGFHGAIFPTWILMLSALVSVPSFIAAAGLGAWGRPGLRSLGLILTLVVNVPSFLILVPTFGSVGAAWASLIGSAVSATFMVIVSSKVLKVSRRSFLFIKMSDLVQIAREVSRFLPIKTRLDRAA